MYFTVVRKHRPAHAQVAHHVSWTPDGEAFPSGAPADAAMTRAHTRDRPGSQRQRGTDRRESGSLYKYQNNSIGHLLTHSLSQVRRALTHGHVHPSFPPLAGPGAAESAVQSPAWPGGSRPARTGTATGTRASTKPDTDGTWARSPQGTYAQREATLRTGPAPIATKLVSMDRPFPDASLCFQSSISHGMFQNPDWSQTRELQQQPRRPGREGGGPR